MQALPFVPTRTATIAAGPDFPCRVPPRWDLRVVQGRRAVRVRLAAVSGGNVTVVTDNEMVLLGDLRGQRVEIGWSFTGLRLRGAVRIARSGIVLLVPDRADLPYLLRALAAPPSTAARAVRSRAA